MVLSVGFVSVPLRRLCNVLRLMPVCVATLVIECISSAFLISSNVSIFCPLLFHVIYILHTPKDYASVQMQGL